MNISKRDNNPFVWVEREDIASEIDQTAWNRLIERLASENGMTIAEFRDFVFWCDANRRTLEDLKKDNTPSLELYRMQQNKKIS